MVILIHGLGRSSFSMKYLDKRMKKASYHAVSFGYPSTKLSIDKLADQLEAFVQAQENASVKKIHFVTHSMGGIVLRAWLHKYPHENVGRIVMLAPPNQGSEVADYFKDWHLYQWMMGPAGQQLGTDFDSILNKLPHSVIPQVGVIAGTKPLTPLYNRVFSGPNDGKVSVKSAKLEGMTDFLELPVSHTFITHKTVVADQVLAYIKYGKFNRKYEASDEDKTHDKKRGNEK